MIVLRFLGDENMEGVVVVNIVVRISRIFVSLIIFLMRIIVNDIKLLDFFLGDGCL